MTPNWQLTRLPDLVVVPQGADQPYWASQGGGPYGSTAELPLWARLLDVTGRAYAENRPYLLPETLGEVTGPVRL